jgi:hypothetical protein
VTNAAAIDPSGRWGATVPSYTRGDVRKAIRIWDLEVMAKLRALTSLQVVEDAASATGYKVDIGPFPGWKDVPAW